MGQALIPLCRLRRRSVCLVFGTNRDCACYILFSAWVTGRCGPEHILHLARVPETHTCRLVRAKFRRVLVALCSKSHRSAKIAHTFEVLCHGIQENHSDSALTLVDPADLVTRIYREGCWFDDITDNDILDLPRAGQRRHAFSPHGLTTGKHQQSKSKDDTLEMHC